MVYWTKEIHWTCNIDKYFDYFLHFSGKEVLEDVASSMQKRFFASSSSLNWIENDRSIRFGAILISKILISQKKFLSWDGIFINISAFVVVVVWFISVFKVLVQHFSNLLQEERKYFLRKLQVQKYTFREWKILGRCIKNFFFVIYRYVANLVKTIQV